MNDSLTALFLLYIKKRGLHLNEMGSWLGIGPKTMADRLRKGVGTWKLEDIVLFAQRLKIPRLALVEQIKYEKENQ